MSKGDPVQLISALHIFSNWMAKFRELEPDMKVVVCGSIRREERMVRDIDILILDASKQGVFNKDAKFEGMMLNLCYMAEKHQGAGLLFLTGSASFNIVLRSKAKKMGMKLNRYGLWKGDDLIVSKTEHDIFAALEMKYIPPTKRRSPDGKMKGILVQSSTSLGDKYEVFVESIHGFYFCECRGFQYRRSCKHLRQAELTV